jgi:hypothetical protein
LWETKKYREKNRIESRRKKGFFENRPGHREKKLEYWQTLKGGDDFVEDSNFQFLLESKNERGLKS